MQEEKQTTEIRETTTRAGDTAERQTTSKSTDISGVVLAQRIVWFIVGVIVAVIALRFVFLLFGSNQTAEFTNFIYNLSAVFVAPFTGIFGEPTYGESVFEISSLLAMVIYLLIGWGIARLLTLGRPHEEI